MMKNLFKNSPLKVSKWISAWTAVFTMVISPVALGKESEKLTMQMMQAALVEAGLNKSITFGEFYARNKNLLPPRIQKEIEPVVTKFKNQKMPLFELVASKGPDGAEVPTMRVSQNGQLINMQWYGEEEKYLKIQNVNLTKIDLINFNDMVVRVLASDEKLRNQTQPLFVKPAVKAPNRNFNFAKYPAVTAQDWVGMSQFDRASYLVNLRLLWLDARNVLNEKEKANPKAKKSAQNFLEKNEQIFELLFGQEAIAQSTPKKCIVAGYITNYEKTSGGEICSHKYIDHVIQQAKSPLYGKAREYCEQQASGQIACNPLVFGTPGGKPTCVMPGPATSFQEATLFNGKCDSASRLQASPEQIKILKDENKTYGRFDDENFLANEEGRKKIFLDEQKGQENFKATKDFMLGLLQFEGKNTDSLFSTGPVDEKLLERVLEIRNAFNTDIDEAKQACKAESSSIDVKNGKRKHERNYWKACDQMNRRFLFVEMLFGSKCDVNSSFDQSSLKCTCNAPAGKKIVPGAKCVNPPATPPPGQVTPSVDQTKPAPVKEKTPCEQRFGLVPKINPNTCECPGGGEPSQTLKGVYECKAKEVEKDKDVECGFLCNFMKHLPMIALTIVGAVVVYKVVGKLFGIKQPAFTNPGDGCASGQPAPCVPTCKAPLAIQTSGVCGCGICAPGQVADAADSCNCKTTATTTTLYICPDGITSKADISQCPYYTCSTQTPPTTYQNPSQCPTGSSSTPGTGTGTVIKTR